MPRPPWRDVDPSGREPRLWLCPACSRRHRPGSLCPPTGVWLVAAGCWACRPDGTWYCPKHNSKGGAAWSG